jgi:hypothetical protein
VQQNCFHKEHIMTSITLQRINTPREPHSVSTAMHELAVATRNLITAIWATLVQRRAHTTLTALEEADELREMAYRLSASDPHFAQDLYAAADRHEMGGSAVSSSDYLWQPTAQ